MIKRDGPGVEEDDFNIKDDEKHRREKVFDWNMTPACGLRRRFNSTFVRFEPGPVIALWSGESGGHHRENRKAKSDGTYGQDRYIKIHKFNSKAFREGSNILGEREGRVMPLAPIGPGHLSHGPSHPRHEHR